MTMHRALQLMNYHILTPTKKYRTRNSRHWSNKFLTTRVIRSPTESDEELRVFIVAGEVSGDVIGSRLMASLKLLSPVNVKFAGVGGSLMVREGLQSQFPMEDLAVMGVWELVPHIHKFWVRLKQATQSALDFQAHVIVTVDSKGFSFRLLKYIRAGCAQKGLACPVCVHYVAPSFWAWKGGEQRLKGLRNIVDHILCILPFEEEICKTNGLAATFVGHPILEDVFNEHASNGSDVSHLVTQVFHHRVMRAPSNLSMCADALVLKGSLRWFQYHGDNLERSKWKVVGDGAKFRKENGLSTDATIISLLPGSRMQEVDRMLPIFGHTLEELKDDFNDLTAAIPVAPNQQVAKSVRKITERWTVPVVLLSGESLESTYNAFDASMAALSTSGTAVLQLQLARLPCVVAYRASLLTEWLIQIRTKLSYISLPNILTDSTVLPEALFSECTPTQLAIMIRQLVQNEDLQNQQAVAAENVFDILMPPVKDLSRAAFQWINSSQLLQKSRAPTPSMVAAVTVLSLIKWK